MFRPFNLEEILNDWDTDYEPSIGPDGPVPEHLLEEDDVACEDDSGDPCRLAASEWLEQAELDELIEDPRIDVLETVQQGDVGSSQADAVDPVAPSHVADHADGGNASSSSSGSTSDSSSSSSSSEAEHDAAPPTVKPEDNAGARADRDADVRIEVNEHGSIRFNIKSENLVAHCIYHSGNCRKSRTSRPSARGNSAQGRPLGLLTAWLEDAANYPDAKSHSSGSAPNLSARQLGRAKFKLLSGSDRFLAYERTRREGEPEEPKSAP